MASFVKNRPVGGGRRSVLLFQVFLIIGFLAVLGYSFWGTVLGRQEQQERLGDLKLVKKVEGAQALAQVSRLHGKEITLKSAFIAEYSSADERVTVWVSNAGSEAAAKDLISRMVRGIEDGNEMFSNLRRLTVSGLEVFQVAGSGGEHYFYISGDKVIWLTIQSKEALPLLQLAIRTF